MRLRIKFTKTGQLKYIGHLDVMRYFQKVLRRASVDVILSGGFSPHMIMSFALPLGVGITSTGEYFDVDVKDSFDDSGLAERLNRQTSEEMRVLNVVRVSEKKADKCMTVVEAADYLFDFGSGHDGSTERAKEAAERFLNFMEQREIRVIKRSKSGEKLSDIRPMILGGVRTGEGSVLAKLSAGSRSHLNPRLLADAFFAEGTGAPGNTEPSVRRTEMYALEGGVYLPLDRCSGVISA